MIEPQPLLTATDCLACAGISMVQRLKIALLMRIAQIGGNAVDVQALLDQGSCLVCAGIDLGSAIEIVLLNQIASGSSSGSGCVATTNGDPEGVLTSNCTPALAVDPNTKAIYLFTGVAGTNTGWELKV